MPIKERKYLNGINFDLYEQEIIKKNFTSVNDTKISQEEKIENNIIKTKM